MATAGTYELALRDEQFLDEHLQDPSKTAEIERLLPRARLLAYRNPWPIVGPLAEFQTLARANRTVARVVHYRAREARTALSFYKDAYRACCGGGAVNRMGREWLAALLHDIGDALGDVGDAKGKLEVLDKAYQLKCEHFGDTAPETTDVARSLAEAYGDLGDHKRKLETLNAILPIVEKHYTETEPLKVAYVLRAKAAAMAALNMDGLEGEKALMIIHKAVGSAHIEFATTLVVLAQTYARMAWNTYDKAATMYGTSLRKDHPLATRAARLRDLALAAVDVPPPVAPWERRGYEAVIAAI